MTYKNANDFVYKMQENKRFRHNMSRLPNDENLDESLEKQGFSFQKKDLIKAMAACMEKMEDSCEI